MNTTWLKFIGTARDKRLADVRADIKENKDCREHAQYLMDLVQFMQQSTERYSDGVD